MWEDKNFVTNNCVGWGIYKKLRGQYGSPFIGSLFVDDSSFVKLAQNYDYYTQLDPLFGEPSTNTTYFKQTGLSRFTGPGIKHLYPVMNLGNIQIHWIHESKDDVIIDKYKRRLGRSENYERIFLLSDHAMTNLYNNHERHELVSTFLNIKARKIFLSMHNDEHDYTFDEAITKFAYIKKTEEEKKELVNIGAKKGEDLTELTLLLGKSLVNASDTNILGLRDFRKRTVEQKTNCRLHINILKRWKYHIP